MQGDPRSARTCLLFVSRVETTPVSGLNVIGLRRAGVPSEARLELRRLFHALFRSRRGWAAAVQSAEAEVGRILAGRWWHLCEAAVVEC